MDSKPEPTTAEELTDFDTFFTPECKSQLKATLTKEIWEEYKDQSCDAGVSFKTCIFSGVANQDSGIGLYAGSHHAYTKFENFEFTAEQSAMVNSTRIRVGRNFADFPLGPGVSKEQRLEIMNKVVEACDNFEDDLKGKFYPLETMTPEDQKQLIEDHFLFKEGDRFLAAANLNRDWPSGRGIFHNDAKTFLIWVNEEDQLRIISMQ